MATGARIVTTERVTGAQELPSSGLWRVAFRRLFRRWLSILGMIILGSLTLVAIFADVIAPYKFNEDFIGKQPVKRFDPPCIHLLGCPASQPEHLMGIDSNVRDTFSRVVYGSRISLTVGITTVTFAIIIGTFLGAVAGYIGGWSDLIVMRLMDVLLAFPSLLLAISIVAVLGPGLINALIAISIVSIPQYARVVRASVISIKEQDFVEASRALGASHLRILFLRILPNSLTPLIVTGTLGIASAILESAALSFIGFGAQPPTPEWGAMLAEERNRIFSAPHMLIFPGVALMLTVLAFNLLGDGLRDALDPRLARSDLGIKRGT